MKSSWVRYGRFSSSAFAAGLVCYVVLALPISPMTWQVLEGFGHRLLLAFTMGLASLLAAWPWYAMFRQSRTKWVVLGGVGYMVMTAIFFPLLVFHGRLVMLLLDRPAGAFQWEDVPRLGAGIVEVFTISIAGGLMASLMSVHVSLPLGIGLAFMYRKVIHAGQGDKPADARQRFP